MRRMATMIAMLVMVSQMTFGSTFVLDCDTPGASLERYDFTTRQWMPLGSDFPFSFTVRRNTLVQVRIKAVGYETFAGSYCVNTAGIKTVNVELFADPMADGVLQDEEWHELFGADVIVSRRSRTPIKAGEYTVQCTNLSTYRTHSGQFCRDENPLYDGGYGTVTIGAMPATVDDPPVKVGDKIELAIFAGTDTSHRICLGYKVLRISLEDVGNGGISGVRIQIP